MGATQQSTADHLPVLALPTGTDALLVEAPVTASLSRRLAELGLRPGVTFQVLSRTSGGGRVLSVQGSRIAIDKATSAMLLGRVHR